MPRNPLKQRCQMPNCRSWAMRGRRHCRAHLDHRLGPRGAGAPQGNSNALKSGRYAGPLSPAELQSLAHRLTEEPESLPGKLDAAVQFIHGRTSKPLHTLILVARLLDQLIPYVADVEYTAGLDAFMQGVPPEKRPGVQSKIWKHALLLDPLERPLLIKAIAQAYSAAFSATFPKERFARQETAAHTDGQDPTSEIDIVDA
jgi:hypothetical protein